MLKTMTRLLKARLKPVESCSEMNAVLRLSFLTSPVIITFIQMNSDKIQNSLTAALPPGLDSGTLRVLDDK